MYDRTIKGVSMSNIKKEGSQLATNCSQLKMPATNYRQIQLSGITGQLPQTVRNGCNCPIISDSCRCDMQQGGFSHEPR